MTNTFMGQTVLGLTNIYGKDYFWMQDGDGVVYLLKAKTVMARSVDDEGNETEFVENLVPDFAS